MIFNYYILTGIISIGLTSCNNLIEANFKQTIQFPSSEEKYDKDKSFEIFLTRFKCAVAKGDANQIKKMAYLPLKTRGIFDSSPYIYIDEKNFEDFYCNFVSEDENKNILINSESYKILTGGNKYEEYIGDWVFRYIDNKWYFYMVYTNDI
jgi:hypothetical protein